MFTRYLKISGLVQGVGFRPYIYRLANEHHLKGWVRNYSGGIEIMIQGNYSNCDLFQDLLREKAPPASEISEISSKQIRYKELSSFSIIPSRNGYDFNADMAPDLAICDSCLEDIKTQKNRYHHLFTSCTHCGPRFSIIKSIPYDRKNTSMENFKMCPECEKEYLDINDRRFHAQPIACLECGPEYTWHEGEREEKDHHKILSLLAAQLEQGKVVAVKGMGGYHLVCDALNDKAIKRIREIKKRDGKPFAVLFKNIDTVKEYANLSSLEEKLLLSARRPILLLKAKKSLSGQITFGLNTLGVMLPYLPLHYLLMDLISLPAIVCTSANLTGEPLISDNEKALEDLIPVCNAVLTHDRNIENKQDDSVIQVVAGKISFIRRSRGYVPQPIFMSKKTDGILAMGADMKNCFCLGKNKKAILSQYIGDLDNYDTNIHYRKTIQDFFRLFHVKPHTLVCDPHPAYHSSKYAKTLRTSFPENQKPDIITVQHHHAHIASVMAENNLDEEVIGICMDGTGYGDDGKIWGSEFMTCRLDNYKRYYHMEYLKLPGGEMAIKEPWRIAVASLYDIYGEDYQDLLDFPVGNELQNSVIIALQSNLNTLESCGMGRLFDLVAALLNICHYAQYDGEGPMRLENLITTESDKRYGLKLENEEFKLEEIIRSVVSDILDHTPVSEISLRFHNTVAFMICEGALRIAEKTGLNRVALSGGTFQNRYLTNKTVKELDKSGLRVYLNHRVPPNDGGLALGQIAVAMKKL